MICGFWAPDHGRAHPVSMAGLTGPPQGVPMKIRSLMARGAVITTLAAGGVGLTSVAAQASPSCSYLLTKVNYWHNLANLDWELFEAYYSSGDLGNADRVF